MNKEKYKKTIQKPVLLKRSTLTYDNFGMTVFVLYADTEAKKRSK